MLKWKTEKYYIKVMPYVYLLNNDLKIFLPDTIQGVGDIAGA